MKELKVVTYNIHKGLSPLNRRVVMHDLREQLRGLDADILFLQEVQGQHSLHVHSRADYPEGPQHEFIAEEVWAHHAYGMNAVYEAGHHGNAILSRFPIVNSNNTNVSAHRYEDRGLLHCEIQVGDQNVHCLCAHFGLFARGRRMQTKMLIAYVMDKIPADAPLIIAGDFNDWRNQLSSTLANELQVHDTFQLFHGKHARSFPAALPLFKLDRIYVRGFEVVDSKVHGGRRMSDHAALMATLNPL